MLLVSGILALASLAVARITFPLPSRLEEDHTAPAKDFTAAYWLYMIAGACFAAGLISYELMAFHLASTKAIGEQWIPVLLAFSTGCSVVASLSFSAGLSIVRACLRFSWQYCFHRFSPHSRSSAAFRYCWPR